MHISFWKVFHGCEFCRCSNSDVLMAATQYLGGCLASYRCTVVKKYQNHGTNSAKRCSRFCRAVQRSAPGMYVSRADRNDECLDGSCFRRAHGSIRVLRICLVVASGDLQYTIQSSTFCSKLKQYYINFAVLIFDSSNAEWVINICIDEKKFTSLFWILS